MPKLSRKNRRTVVILALRDPVTRRGGVRSIAIALRRVFRFINLLGTSCPAPATYQIFEFLKSTTISEICSPPVSSTKAIQSILISLFNNLKHRFTRRFCSQLGALFGFVVKDLQDKIDRLNYLIADDEQHFSTVQNMILYEKSNDMVKGNSGCVTLLRLHRGLGNSSEQYSFHLFTYTI
jgi:hypothetical protein